MSVGSTLARVHVLFRQHLLTSLDHPRHTIHASCTAFAGHNKWSKVKNVKGPKDNARSRVFQKLAMMIRLAVKGRMAGGFLGCAASQASKPPAGPFPSCRLGAGDCRRGSHTEGGPNPDLNTNLANIIEQCRRKSMPKSSIEAAITGGDKTKSSYLLYEARGPGGSSLLIEILTDNAKRSFQEIRRLLSQHGGLLADGARHSFEKKGIVAVSREDRTGSPVSLDRALELAIEAGAEDVQEEEDEDEKIMLKFICAVPTLRQVREKLESLGLCSLSASLEFIPTAGAQLSDEEMECAAQLLEALRECLDVVRVYDNIA